MLCERMVAPSGRGSPLGRVFTTAPAEGMLARPSGACPSGAWLAHRARVKACETIEAQQRCAPSGRTSDACVLACVRDDAIARGDDDADDDRVAVGADHDGAEDEGADHDGAAAGADHDGAEDEGERRMWLCV